MRFTPQEEAALRAAVDRILPADDFPGAWEAGARPYLERQLDGDLAGSLAVFRMGLVGPDAEAVARFGVALAAVPPDDQDALLRDVEKGAVRAAWSVEPA